MADYSMGDRVEVRWQAELFDAAVTEVEVRHWRQRGDILDGEEHRLKFLGDEEEKGGGGKKTKVCVVGGCPTIARLKGQLCVKHGGKPCSIDAAPPRHTHAGYARNTAH